MIKKIDNLSTRKILQTIDNKKNKDNKEWQFLRDFTTSNVERIRNASVSFIHRQLMLKCMYSSGKRELAGVEVQMEKYKKN